jgi:hypothetical protein
MAVPTRIQGAVEFAGSVVFTQSLTLPAGTVDDDAVVAGAEILSTKVKQRFHVGITQPTSVRKATINLYKSTSGSTWASILTAASTADSTRTNRTSWQATLNTTACSVAEGDILKLSIVTAGSSGTKGKGLAVQAVLIESGA